MKTEDLFKGDIKCEYCKNWYLIEIVKENGDIKRNLCFSCGKHLSYQKVKQMISIIWGQREKEENEIQQCQNGCRFIIPCIVPPQNGEKARAWLECQDCGSTVSQEDAGVKVRFSYNDKKINVL